PPFRVQLPDRYPVVWELRAGEQGNECLPAGAAVLLEVGQSVGPARRGGRGGERTVRERGRFGRGDARRGARGRIVGNGIGRVARAVRGGGEHLPLDLHLQPGDFRGQILDLG